MNKYFKDCKTCEDVKQLYKKLARELHPDCNPDKDTTKDFQEMFSEYQRVYEQYKNIHVNAQGETYTKENTQTAAEFADIINKLLNIPNLVIELCGSWLWVTGNTYDARKELKELHFSYSSKKGAWYFHFEPYRKKSKSECTMESIRNMYGSEKYATKTMEKDLLPA